MRKIVLSLGLGLFLAGGGAVYSQEVAPLILDERPASISGGVRKNNPTPEDKPAVEAAPTPRPEDVFVAVVNSRRMSRAELDARVSSQYEKARAEVQRQIGGVVANIDDGSYPLLSDLNKEEGEDVLEEQKVHIEAAMRREEEQALKDWMEHGLLADEARRQGIAVSEGEFRQRLASAEQESNLDVAKVQQVLDSFQMTREEYEKGVYEALMIEKLLERFIQLNYTEEQFREAYNKAPHLFYEPEKFMVAHFVVALNGNETDSELKNKKAMAARARALLRAGEKPETIFETPEFLKPDQGIGGTVSGYYTLTEQVLPPIVEHEGRKLKVGQVSEVLTNQRRSGSKIVPVSYHVVMVMERAEPTGQTFESAMPQIHKAMLVLAREALMARIYEAKTHRVMTNLGGLNPELVPDQEAIYHHEANAQPINLRLPKS